MKYLVDKFKQQQIARLVATGDATALAREAQKDPQAFMAFLRASQNQCQAALQERDEALKNQGIDSLTKIPDRKTLETSLDIEIALIQRGRSQGCTVAFFDLIGFKGINDKQGYEAGDRAICLFAHALSDQVPRATDKVARLGGDEFIVMLSGTDPDSAQKKIEEIATALNASLKLDVENAPSIPLRARYGTATYEPGDTPASLIYRADPKGKKNITPQQRPSIAVA